MILPGFFTVEIEASLEQTIERSRFLAKCARVDSPEEAMVFVKKFSSAEATHNCWAYRIGAMQYRFSDDGEPGGSAGKPIFLSIENANLDHAVVLVTRFFGGVKLGTGGLARAYGGTALECLKIAGRREVVPTVRVLLSCDFQFSNTLYHLIEGWTKVSDEYFETGVGVVLELEARQLEQAIRDWTERSNGRIIATVAEPQGLEGPNE